MDAQLVDQPPCWAAKELILSKPRPAFEWRCSRRCQCPFIPRLGDLDADVFLFLLRVLNFQEAIRALLEAENDAKGWNYGTHLWGLLTSFFKLSPQDVEKGLEVQLSTFRKDRARHAYEIIKVACEDNANLETDPLEHPGTSKKSNHATFGSKMEAVLLEAFGLLLAWIIHSQPRPLQWRVWHSKLAISTLRSKLRPTRRLLFFALRSPFMNSQTMAAIVPTLSTVNLFAMVTPLLTWDSQWLSIGRTFSDWTTANLRETGPPSFSNGSNQPLAASSKVSCQSSVSTVAVPLDLQEFMIALLLLCACSSKSAMDKVAGWKSWGRRPSAPEVPTKSKPFMVSSTMVWLGNCISANISFKTSNLFPLGIFCLCFGQLSWSFFSSASSCIALVVHFFKRAALSLAIAAGTFVTFSWMASFTPSARPSKNPCWVSSLQGFLDEALDSPWGSNCNFPQLALLPLLVNRFLRNAQNATISREGDSVHDYIIFEFGANIERWSLGNDVDHNVAPLWYEG